ncbi:unnamed protein product [Auanema sp. JU1783]|nr:unnamed protein product [Auanema sp. JU1783]
MPSSSVRKHTISNKVRKRPGKDLDQIHEDLKPEKAAKLMNQEIDLDLPGDGQFYCIECARHFTDEKTITAHKKSKPHKNRVKTLKEVPYTVKESEAAGGLGYYPHVTKKSRVTHAEYAPVKMETVESSDIKQEDADVKP